MPTAKDPFWVEPQGNNTTVMMNPGHAVMYQRWLRSNGWHLYQIPDSDVYGIGVRVTAGARHDA